MTTRGSVITQSDIDVKKRAKRVGHIHTQTPTKKTQHMAAIEG